MKKAWPLLWLALYRRRRLVVALAVGLILFEALIVVITAAIPTDQLFSSKSTPSSFNAFSGSSGDVSLASIPGLLGAGLVHPFWVALELSAVASFGAATVASDIEEGTIELIAVRPLSRMRILAERAGAMLITCVILSAAAMIPLAVGVESVSKLRDNVISSGLFAATASAFALVIAFAGIAVAFSCTSRHRSTVMAAVGGIAAVSYAINFVSQAWHPARFTKWVSLFHYYRPADALASGKFPWSDVTVLLAVCVAGFVFGALRLRSRDLTR